MDISLFLIILGVWTILMVILAVLCADAIMRGDKSCRASRTILWLFDW